MPYIKKRFFSLFLIASLVLFAAACSEDSTTTPIDNTSVKSASSADYSTPVAFQGSKSSASGKIYEILPGPAVINPAMNPTPFSNSVQMTDGSYEIVVEDNVDVDSQNSTDAVSSVNFEFTANDGKRFKVDQINIIHKPDGMGDHTFYGGVGLNKMMHGDTKIGTGLMPKMLSYITLWGIVDLKDANTGEVVAAGRIVHIMVASRVRDENLDLIPSVDKDASDHDTWAAETHFILIPQDKDGNPSPVPGTDHGFIHMMWENVELTNANRDWKQAFEILPGPAAINPAMNPTPFSNKVAFGSGSFSLDIVDKTDADSETSEDAVKSVNIKYQRPNGEMFVIDEIRIIHKAEGTGDHTFFGGVGIDKEMHGNTGIGNGLMPKMLSYITLWGITDLKDGNGNVIAANRAIHMMVSSRTRTADLKLITNTETDATDHSSDKVETHIILPPLDMEGNPSPVPGTGHGFLHLMFENVNLTKS
ncbi:MAG: hypothetical protein GXO87_05925 [Chlorobi bacterium]|nr:hypothetical protein [Chlorobiota bacterium]